MRFVLPATLSICGAVACANPGPPKPPVQPDPLPDVAPQACGTLVAAPPPAYPFLALRKAQTGWVLVAFDVTEAGGVANVEVVRSSPQGVFEDSAMEAVRSNRFRASGHRREDCTQLIEFNIGRWDK